MKEKSGGHIIEAIKQLMELQATLAIIETFSGHIIEAIKQLMEPPKKPRKRIGF